MSLEIEGNKNGEKMDIITTARSRLKASLDEATFELNSCLEKPTEDGSLGRFSKAVHKYTNTMMQIETLHKLQQEIEQAEPKGNEA